jgi:hypothetical protein
MLECLARSRRKNLCRRLLPPLALFFDTSRAVRDGRAMMGDEVHGVDDAAVLRAIRSYTAVSAVAERISMPCSWRSRRRNQ